MTRHTRRVLCYVLAAVTVLVGGLNGYFAFAGHEATANFGHELAGAHGHHHHHHDHGVAAATALALHPDWHEIAECGSGETCMPQDNSDHDIQGGHVHCCASSAAAIVATGFAIYGDRREPRQVLASAVPAGKTSTPLLRPPRALG